MVTGTHEHIGAVTDHVQRLFDREQRASRQFESALAWDQRLREAVTVRLGWPTNGFPHRAVAQLDWPDAPAVVAAVLSVWRGLPRRLQAVAENNGWPTVTRTGARTAAQFWLLVLRADDDQELRLRLLDDVADEVAHTTDAYPFAVAVDHSLALLRGYQRYGTMRRSSGDLEVAAEPGRDIDQCRVALGLPRLSVDVSRELDAMAVLRWLGLRAAPRAGNRDRIATRPTVRRDGRRQGSPT